MLCGSYKEDGLHTCKSLFLFLFLFFFSISLLAGALAAMPTVEINPFTSTKLICSVDYCPNNLHWDNITDFPPACPAGEYATQIGPTLTCSVPSGSDTNESSRVYNLTLTDCGGTGKVVGIEENGSVKCAPDVDTDTDTATNMSYRTVDNYTSLLKAIDFNVTNDSYVSITNQSIVLGGQGNRTLVDCSNITGAASDLCSLVDTTGADYSNISFINISNTFETIQNFTDVNISGNLFVKGIEFLYNHTLAAVSWVTAQVYLTVDTWAGNSTASVINVTANNSMYLDGKLYDESWNSTTNDTIYAEAKDKFNLTYHNYATNVSLNWTELAIDEAHNLFMLLSENASLWAEAKDKFNATYDANLDTNESSRFYNLTLTDCGTNSVAIGIEVNGSIKCIADLDTATNSSYRTVDNYTGIFKLSEWNVTNESYRTVDNYTGIFTPDMFNVTNLSYREVSNFTGILQVKDFNVTNDSYVSVINASVVLGGQEGRVLVDCSNITNSESDLCTLVDTTGADYSNVSFTNKSNTFNGIQNFTDVNVSGTLFAKFVYNHTLAVYNIWGKWFYNMTLGAMVYTDARIDAVNTTFNLQSILNSTDIYSTTNMSYRAVDNLTGIMLSKNFNVTNDSYWQASKGSYNATYAANLDTNESSRMFNLTLTDCGAGSVVMGVEENGSVKCIADATGTLLDTFAGNYSASVINITVNNSIFLDGKVYDANWNSTTNDSYVSIINSSLVLSGQANRTTLHCANITGNTLCINFTSVSNNYTDLRIGKINTTFNLQELLNFTGIYSTYNETYAANLDTDTFRDNYTASIINITANNSVFFGGKVYDNNWNASTNMSYRTVDNYTGIFKLSEWNATNLSYREVSNFTGLLQVKDFNVTNDSYVSIINSSIVLGGQPNRTTLHFTNITGIQNLSCSVGDLVQGVNFSNGYLTVDCVTDQTATLVDTFAGNYSASVINITSNNSLFLSGKLYDSNWNSTTNNTLQSWILSVNTTLNLQTILNGTGIYSTLNATYQGYSINISINWTQRAIDEGDSRYWNASLGSYNSTYANNLDTDTFKDNYSASIINFTAELNSTKNMTSPSFRFSPTLFFQRLADTWAKLFGNLFVTGDVNATNFNGNLKGTWNSSFLYRDVNNFSDIFKPSMFNVTNESYRTVDNYTGIFTPSMFNVTNDTYRTVGNFTDLLKAKDFNVTNMSYRTVDNYTNIFTPAMFNVTNVTTETTAQQWQNNQTVFNVSTASTPDCASGMAIIYNGTCRVICGGKNANITIC